MTTQDGQSCMHVNRNAMLVSIRVLAVLRLVVDSAIPSLVPWEKTEKETRCSYPASCGRWRLDIREEVSMSTLPS